jgi:hypothetical protein
MGKFLWIECNVDSGEPLLNRDRVLIRGWTPKDDTDFSPYCDGANWYVPVDAIPGFTVTEWDEEFEEGYGVIPELVSLELVAIRGLEWEDFPDYGGGDESSQEPTNEGDYHSWVAYRAGEYKVN